MEDKKEEVKSYLKENVNPIIEPMLQRIAEEKPWDVLVWISTWVNQRIGKNLFTQIREKYSPKRILRVTINLIAYWPRYKQLNKKALRKSAVKG